jgi:excisionase family DNA binding protein
VTSPKALMPPVYTVLEVAELLKVSDKTVRRWIKAGDLIAHRLGHQLRLTEADVAAFIRQRREA